MLIRTGETRLSSYNSGLDFKVFFLSVTGISDSITSRYRIAANDHAIIYQLYSAEHDLTYNTPVLTAILVNERIICHVCKAKM